MEYYLKASGVFKDDVVYTYIIPCPQLDAIGNTTYINDVLRNYFNTEDVVFCSDYQYKLVYMICGREFWVYTENAYSKMKEN